MRGCTCKLRNPPRLSKDKIADCKRHGAPKVTVHEVVIDDPRPLMPYPIFPIPVTPRPTDPRA